MLRTIQGYLMILCAIAMWVAMDHADTMQQLTGFMIAGMGCCALAGVYFVLALIKR